LLCWLHAPACTASVFAAAAPPNDAILTLDRHSKWLRQQHDSDRT
jgi:hypothetical protein